jgi:hypothetical protein
MVKVAWSLYHPTVSFVLEIHFYEFLSGANGNWMGSIKDNFPQGLPQQSVFLSNPLASHLPLGLPHFHNLCSKKKHVTKAKPISVPHYPGPCNWLLAGT